MQALFDVINMVCGKIQVVSDLFWDFPTNFDWYANIPILGNFSLAIILLVGSGIFFSFRLGFVQVRRFTYGLRVLRERAAESTGISPLAALACRATSRRATSSPFSSSENTNTSLPSSRRWLAPGVRSLRTSSRSVGWNAESGTTSASRRLIPVSKRAR